MIAFRVGGVYLRNYILAMLFIAVVIYFCEVLACDIHTSKKIIAIRVTIAFILSGIWQYFYEGAAFLIPTYIMLVITFLRCIIYCIKRIIETAKAPVVTENKDGTEIIKSETVHTKISTKEKVIVYMFFASMIVVTCVLFYYTGLIG